MKSSVFALILLAGTLGATPVTMDQKLVPGPLDSGELAKRTNSYLLKSTEGGPLDGFDPGDSDKLVVQFSSEGDHEVAVTAVTYGGMALTEAAGGNSQSGRHHAGIYFLDKPPAAADLRIEFDVVSGQRFGLAVSLLALSGTADGMGATAVTATGENLVALAPKGEGSLVLAANVFNSGEGSNPGEPLTPLVDGAVGSASHGVSNDGRGREDGGHLSRLAGRR